jgi:20S proteasome alpha/beta subunit
MQPVQPSFHPATAATPTTHTTEPKIVRTSFLAMKYYNAIVLAANNLGNLPCVLALSLWTDYLASFQSPTRFKDLQRIFHLGENTLIAYSRDISDA